MTEKNLNPDFHKNVHVSIAPCLMKDVPPWFKTISSFYSLTCCCATIVDLVQMTSSKSTLFKALLRIKRKQLCLHYMSGVIAIGQIKCFFFFFLR